MRRRGLLLWAAAAPAWASEARPVEVNTAGRAELESLPGLGPARVQQLLAGRPFADWDDLMRRVPGLKAATARRLDAAGLRVNGQRLDTGAPARPA